MDAGEARQTLFEVMNQDREFEWKVDQALSIGEDYLDVQNAHMTEIHTDSDYWRSIASTDPPDGDFLPGLVLDLSTSYCRRIIADGGSIALHDAPEQGWADDPAYETHGLHCYHGTSITLEGELYGTLCFVSESAREDPFTEEETLFAELIARMLQHELQRERTEDKIERLERFADLLAHDLRNPLAGATGYLEIVLDRTDDDQLRTVAKSLDRMETIISDVLTMVRQGRSIEETDEVQLETAVERCWESIGTKHANLVVEDDPRFRAAPDRLRHLFENLFRNAIEHGNESVTIRVGALDDADGFYVEDDGPGIAEAERETVFNRGYSTGTEGLGLGLAIVDGVVAAHDWEISVTEGSEGGARFEIRDVVVLDPIVA